MVWWGTLGEGLDKWGYGLLPRGYNEMMGPQHTRMSFKYLKALLLLCGKYKYRQNTLWKIQIQKKYSVENTKYPTDKRGNLTET